MNTEKNEASLFDKPIHCERCDGKLNYLSSGQYQCELCGYIQYDDFGKVKAFLDEYGTASTPVISKATGVKESVIDDFLMDGRIQIAKGSKYFLKCEKCGSDIRFGRFCQKCINDFVGRIESAMDADKEEFYDQESITGKMRFFKKK